MKQVTGPYIKSKNNTSKMMFNLLLALLPIIIFTIYKNGILPYQAHKINILEVFYPLIFIILPAIVSWLFETLFAIIFLKKRNKDIIRYIKDSYGFFPGLFLGLILPLNMPIWIVLLGAMVASLSKMIFGGFGKNIFNPALVGYLFIFLIFTNYFQVNGGYLNKLEIDTISSSTPLSNSIVVDGIGTYDSLIKPYGSLLDFFIGTIPGTVGETSTFLCLLAFFYLSITKVIKWKISLVYVLTVFFATFMIGNINHLGIWYPLFQVLSGGLMFGAVFMATDPVTSPVTSQGQILYGLFLGILTVVIRYLMPYSDGVFISVIIMNTFVKLLDTVGFKTKFDFRKSILSYLVAWLLIIGLGFYIGNNYLAKGNELDNNFKILSREQLNNKVTYIVTQKGNIGDIKATVVFNNNKVIYYEVLEQKEPLYYKIQDSNYLEMLVSNQFNLDNVDVVSGAKDTSMVLKKLLQNVLNDYNNSDIQIIEQPEEMDFEVVSFEEFDNKIVYKINKKSFGGNLELRITFNHDIIEEITILKQNDPYFDLIIDANYITTLISKQQELDNVDIVSGAEVSSKALKEAVIKTIEDYQNRKGSNTKINS